MSKRIVPTLLAGALAAGTILTGAPAMADQKVAVDWMRFLADAQYVAKRGADVLDAPRCSETGCEVSPTATAPERHYVTRLQNTQSSLFALAPRFSLVARDWSAAYKVSGERLALVDETRLTSSSRMVLSRIRLNTSRISPYAQVGLGQWRIDPYLMPLNQRYTEMAAEAAIGIEVRVIGTWNLAAQTSTTMLYREYREPKDAAAPGVQIWNTTLVSRIDF